MQPKLPNNNFDTDVLLGATTIQDRRRLIAACKIFLDWLLSQEDVKKQLESSEPKTTIDGEQPPD